MKRLWQTPADRDADEDTGHGIATPSMPDQDRLRTRLQSAIDRARLMPVAPPEVEAEVAPQPALPTPLPTADIAPLPADDAEAPIAVAPADLSEAPSVERRSAFRKKTTFSIGKIAVGDDEHFCIIRDMSDTGVRIEMRQVPAVGTRVLVEMRTTPPCWATIRWRQGELAGLAFETSRALDPKAEPARLKQSWIARTPRFKLAIPARLKMLHRRITLETADITLGGLKLKGAHELSSGTQADVMFGDSLRPFAGHVCWTTKDSLGFRFDTALSRESLVAIMDMARPH